MRVIRRETSKHTPPEYEERRGVRFFSVTLEAPPNTNTSLRRYPPNTALESRLRLLLDRCHCHLVLEWRTRTHTSYVVMQTTKDTLAILLAVSGPTDGIGQLQDLADDAQKEE